MKVHEIMCKDIGCVTTSDRANDAARVMWDCDCGIVPVVRPDTSGQLAGVITDRDICMAAYTQGKPLAEISVESAMAKQVLTCRADDSIQAVEQLLKHARIRRVPAVDAQQRLVGMVSLADIAREAEREKPLSKAEVNAREVGETLASITQPRPQRTNPTAGAGI